MNCLSRSAARAAKRAIIAAMFVAAPAMGQAQADGFFTLTGEEAAGYAAPSDTTLIRSMPMERFGLTYERYQQTHEGAKVLGGQVTIHRDDDGNVVRVIGAHYPDIVATNSVRITAAGARGLVDRDIGPDGERDVTLMIDPDSGEFFWRVETRRAASRWVHWIGAQSGATLNKFDALTNQGCANGEGFGVAYDRDSRFDTDIHWDDRKNLDCLITPSGPGTSTQLKTDRQETHDQGSSRRPFLGPVATNGDEFWITPGRESPGTGALVDAHYYMALADAYFLDQYSFDFMSLYDKPITVHAHFTKNYVNAFWNGSYFAFGDGNGVSFDPLTSMDVAAHEFAHSVTEQFSDLIYQDESGALNESFSDIFAAVIERLSDTDVLTPEPDGDLAVPGTEWLIGEDFDLVGDGFRDMADPTTDGDPAHYDDLYTGSQDNGGVHRNSGIPNHAFYWLVEETCGQHDPVACVTTGAGVDIQRAADVFYLGFTALTSTADFCDARDATIAMAAEGLPEEVGVTDITVEVTAAWDHVGVLCDDGVVGDDPPNAGFFYSCDNNRECTFTDTSTDNGTISWSWSFGDTNTSIAQNPIHTYAANGTYNVSLTVTDDASPPQEDTANASVQVSDGSGVVTDVDRIDPTSMLAADSPVTVTITGSGFGANVSVTFLNGSGPTPVASIISATDTTITATVLMKQKGKKGTVDWDVMVSTSNGSDVLVDGFRTTR